VGISLEHITKNLQNEDTKDYRSLNSSLFLNSDKACIVIDDDPTGNQTVYDIPLLSSWSIDVFVKEFIEGTPVFFVLTNSRSLTAEATSKIYKEIAENILKASELTQRKYTIISRSDSTLRGHFPLEPEVLKLNLGLEDAITAFIPVMFEGKRVTINGTHYIRGEDTLTPVNETPFAQDHTFKYSKANLKAYIEEKSSGRINSEEVFSFSLDDIRKDDVNVLAENILEIPAKSYCVFDSLNYKDLDKVVHTLLLAEKLGKQIVYRTSSSFVPSYIGLPPKGLLSSVEVIDKNNTNGGLTIVGSYVKKSSEQLRNALELYAEHQIIEVDVKKVLSDETSNYITEVITHIDAALENGEDVIVFTSRDLVTGKDSNSTINIGNKISVSLVNILEGIHRRPRYLIVKGGITSHDLATKGLGMRRSKVLGQIQPGIPIWEMGEETKFPRLPYVVFPGNVGDKSTLQTIITKLKHHDQ